VADGGGSERALIAMIRSLTSSGWECHVALPDLPALASEYRDAGAILHIVPMNRLSTSGSQARWLRYCLGWPRSVVALSLLARRVGADVVHSNSLHCWYGWAAALVTGRPHVWHAREIVFQSSAALRLERFMTKKFAQRVIAISGAVAAQLDEGNVVVLTDEADPSTFNPGRAGRFRYEAGIADEVPLIGSVARLDTWKGFDTLLDAFPMIKERRPDAELVIAGPVVPGKELYAATLESRARSMSGVHWLGPRSDVAEIMADCDVFVQVSSQPEPFGLVIVEALACGTPVVAGDAGGPAEIIAAARDSRGACWASGVLVPPRDPASLAAATVGLLPAGPSSTDRRRSRTALADARAGGFEELFSSVLQPGRVRLRRRRR
jgi:glycosyltransferase involved in cell wall biosynthesis